MTLPTFLVIGAAKAGTTSLAAYLATHPDIFIPPGIKEPNFFAFPEGLPEPRGPVPAHVLRRLLYSWSRTDEPGYRALFAPGAGHRARGEASVRYLYFPGTAGRVRAMIPEVRLVAVLREPAARLVSHWNMNRQLQIEPLDLRAALAAEPARIARGWGWDWHYAALGRYAAQLEPWYAAFPAERIAVFLYDDFVADPLGTLRAICRHIGVGDDFTPDMSGRGMVPYRPRLPWLDRFLLWPNPLLDPLKRPPWDRFLFPVLTRIQKRNRGPVPPVDPGLLAEIRARFAADNAALAARLGRTLPW